jgi:putative membrane protein
MTADGTDKPQAEEDPRVRLAGERTLLAWIRTGVAMMGFGFVVARFGLFLRELAVADHTRIPPSTGLSLWLGTCLVLLGVAVTALAAAQHYRFLRRLNRREGYRPPRWSLGLIVAGVLAALGAAMAAYLVVIER